MIKNIKKATHDDSNVSTFTPQGDFDESTYVRVNDRIKQFYQQYPEGILHTVRLKEEGGVVFKTYVLRDDADVDRYAATGVGKAIGYSYLPDSSRQEMKVEEYAETVSVGRALAKFGIEIEKSIASAEEMDQFSRVHKGSTPLSQEESDLADEMIAEETELPKLKTTRTFENRGSKFAAKN